jgi:hypothetical protein
MNNAKLIAKICVAACVVLAGIFYQFNQTLMADSYVSGGSTPTLQEVVDTGATASGSIVLNANAANDALSCSHGAGAGDCIDITNHTGSGAGIKINITGTGRGIQVEGDASTDRVIYGGGSSTSVSSFDWYGGYGVNAPVMTLTSYGDGAFILGTELVASAGTNPMMTLNSMPNGLSNSMAFRLSRWGNIATGYGVLSDNTNMIFASSSVSTGGGRFRNINSDANGINLIFERAPLEVGAASDDLSNITSTGRNDTSTTADYIYSQITSEIVSAATGTIDGGMYFRVVSDSSLDAPIVMVGGAAEMITMAWPLTANTLQFDDEAMDTYNEGTWTPVYDGYTTGDCATGTSVAVGKYTQTGNVIHADGIMTVDGCLVTPTGGPYITLPVAASSLSGYNAGCAFGQVSEYPLTASHFMTGIITETAQLIQLNEQTLGNDASVSAPAGVGWTIIFSCTYLVD